MKHQRITLIGIATLGLLFLVSCSSTQNQVQNQQEQKQGKGNMPAVSQLISQMDSNNDGKLSKSEVKGPLLNDFSKIDSNNNGYLEEDELKNAPKPQGRPGGMSPR